MMFIYMCKVNDYATGKYAIVGFYYLRGCVTLTNPFEICCR